MLQNLPARARRGPVPLPVLLSDDGADYASWRKRLTDELGNEAKRAGLASRRSGRGAWLIAAAALTGTLVAAMAGFSIRPADGKTALEVGFYVSLLSLAVPAIRRRWRLTPEGTEAVGWWRQHVTAAALPGAWPASGARTDLPAAAAGLRWPAGRPVPRGHAWSSLGGQWHPVRVGPQPRPSQWSTLSTLAGWSSAP